MSGYNSLRGINQASGVQFTKEAVQEPSKALPPAEWWTV